MPGPSVTVPRLIVVTGPSAVGKTTLAHRLAGELGCPLLSRDEIKQGMVATVGAYDPRGEDPLALAAYDTFFAAISLLLAAGTTLVAEAAFQHRLWSTGLARLDVPYALRLLRCTADPELLAERHEQRRHAAVRAAHDDTHPVPGGAAYDALRLDGLGGEARSLDVATDKAGRPGGDYHPGFAEIVAFCRG